MKLSKPQQDVVALMEDDYILMRSKLTGVAYLRKAYTLKVGKSTFNVLLKNHIIELDATFNQTEFYKLAEPILDKKPRIMITLK
jgi:hypothetical protein